MAYNIQYEFLMNEKKLNSLQCTSYFGSSKDFTI